MIAWRTYEDLVRDSLELAAMLPRDTVGVLGVPRSGMIPASVVAQELGCHLGSVEEFVASGGSFMRPGRRMSWAQAGRTLVVVDDSAHTGLGLERALQSIRSNPLLGAAYDVKAAVVYMAPGNEDRIEWRARTLEMPRLFQWNWLAHDILETSICDLDGVLCADPTAVEDHDPWGYSDQLKTAAPLLRPRRKLGSIVTGRLEAYRSLTEEWLRQHGITYAQLVMAPFGSPAERRAYSPARWKGEVYKASDWKLAVESDSRQAPQMSALADGRPVLCVETNRIYQSEDRSPT